ncbi:CoA pyrophosphatase [Desulfobacter hydrogenophilus]|uniref:CoA pyrophosphatase n=1 Tax=Desulfobacter hydrogenophilus TaxID=2291 RepID=A0A328FCK6_9BACT|nr:CoA pyrophosphatase [Desulfobacter hydrogenophilus]NDY71930.1 CoA pyrophosphatase [Desulfobacter hydrogenophilus]QBH12378.1 CoA pyrophosphatase [Desulfobacter hydrogenophilus]RAM02019.1 CoA pyrophosphatase [Desulfobacter hydrogenophilus]
MNTSSYIEIMNSAIVSASHPPAPDPAQFKSTAVMALFFFRREPTLLFIQKADREGYAWRNQMAFPGGHVEQTDASVKQAAFRELYEETGIVSDNVEYIGSLGHFQTLKNRDIQAFTGIWNQKDEIVFETEEISRVLEIPFETLLKTHRKNGYAGHRPNVMELTYPYKDVVIWGVTAQIVHHLIEVIGEIL